MSTLKFHEESYDRVVSDCEKKYQNQSIARRLWYYHLNTATYHAPATLTQLPCHVMAAVYHNDAYRAPIESRE